MIATAATSSLAWGITAGATLVTGLWLLRRGWRGRRVGDDPHCKKCGYSLVGLERTRCPECGADVSGDKSIRIGRLTRRPRAIMSGAAMAVIALTFLSVTGWPRLRDFDWYTVKPTGWVLDDLASVNSPNHNRAATEIFRRLRAGPLPQRHHDRLVEMALAEQAATIAAVPRSNFPLGAAATNPALPISPVASSLLSWATGEAEEGRLNPRQLARLCEQSQVLRVVSLPMIVDGNPLRYSVQREEFGMGYFWYVRATNASMSIDGRPYPLNPADRAAIGRELGRHASLGSEFYGISGEVLLSGLGPHELTLNARLEIWRIAWAGKEKRLIYGFDARSAATVEVVSSDAVRAPPGTVTEAQIRAALRFHPFEVVKGKGVRQLFGEVDILQPRTDLRFQLLARIAGKEYPLGSLRCPAGREARLQILGDYDGPPDVTMLDLILRPDAAAMRETVNSTNIWSEEVVLKDVRFYGVPKSNQK